MISTRPSHSTTVVDSGKTNFQNECIMKPQVVLDYNEGRQGIDLSDQLSAYYTCLRKSIKWYRKVAFELIFGTALVNSYLIYKENYTETKVTILQFRESLVRSLLLGMPFEKLKPGPRQQSTSRSKRKLADHKLEEKKGSDRDVRRRCVGCYEKNREQQSREACHSTTKRIKTFCSDCNNFFCLDCFNKKHYAM
jgi:Transposase IS4